MKTIDLAKDFKDLYTATRKVKEVTAAAGTFLAVEAAGEPGGKEFQNAFMAIYSVAYTMKFALKEQGTLDFKVNKPECVYLAGPFCKPKSPWRWQIMLRIPDEVTAKDVTATKKVLREKKGLDTSAVKRLRWKEGRALQVLHVGPYDQVGATYEQLGVYAAEHGLKVTGPGHEIYISDPRRVAPEKLKTIVRLGVKK
jgi:hypothetical protein